MFSSLLLVPIAAIVVIIIWKWNSNRFQAPELSRDNPSVQKAIREKLELKRRSLLSRPRSQDTPSSTSAEKVPNTNTKDPFNYKSKSSALPVGQYPAKKWIILDLGLRPSIADYDPWSDPGRFELSFGAQRYCIDWHCVTGWSFCGLELVGVPLTKIIEKLAPGPKWDCLFQVSADGYTAPILRADLDEYREKLGIEPFLAFAIIDSDTNSALFGSNEIEVNELQVSDLELLSLDHGGPRIVVPSLYGWKSAKFLKEVHFLSAYRPGFWENLGCNKRGRHALNERWSQESALIWNILSWMTLQYQTWGGYNVWIFVMQRGGNFLGFFADKLFGAFERN